jgi:AAA15 family ATPase/GTPase
MGDTSKHLTYIKVENFKRFESLEMNDLGQFNLILGDNNVGKTSVLEALLVEETGWKFINNLLIALDYRNLKSNYTYEDLRTFLKIEGRLSGDQIINYNLRLQNGQKINVGLDFNRQRQVLDFVGVSHDSTSYPLHQSANINFNFSSPFLPFYRGHDQDLTTFYSKLQQDRSLKKYFINGLKTLVPALEEIELSVPYVGGAPHLIMYQTDMNSSLPLALFGDGTLKLFRFLAEIIINNGNRLMIDEVDAGIHYSRFKEFWKTILTAANDNNVQLFMTTHNEECIKYFKEVLENDLPELQEKSRSITLVENSKTKKVSAYTYTFNQLEANIDSGNELRGGIR